MRRIVIRGALIVVALLVIAGCGGGPEPAPVSATAGVPAPIARRPDVLDHRNYRFGRDIPEWVVLETNELEQRTEFSDVYVFKFESPRSQSLQGAELWTRNFTAAADIAQTVRNRVQVKFAGAAVGDMDMVESYMEQVVLSFSDAQFSGYQRAADYWMQMRYYNPDGGVEQDAYSYYVLYTIPRNTLDRMIRDALANADRNQPVTEEEQTARDRVKEAFENGLRL
jgi:hypothetical protein